jgi:hypothetical protein
MEETIGEEVTRIEGLEDPYSQFILILTLQT